MHFACIVREWRRWWIELAQVQHEKPHEIHFDHRVNDDWDSPYGIQDKDYTLDAAATKVTPGLSPSDSGGAVTYSTVLRRRVPDRVRGRVVATLDAVWATGEIASIGLAGLLVDHVGIVAIYLGGCTLLMLAGECMRFSSAPSFRRAALVPYAPGGDLPLRGRSANPRLKTSTIPSAGSLAPARRSMRSGHLGGRSRWRQHAWPGRSRPPRGILIEETIDGLPDQVNDDPALRADCALRAVIGRSLNHRWSRWDSRDQHTPEVARSLVVASRP